MSAISLVFEVKLRERGDRGVDYKGKTIEGGKVFSRHYEANGMEHAAGRALKRFPNCVVVSVEKVHKDDIIGKLDFKDILYRPTRPVSKDPIVNNTRIDEIFFKRRK